MLCYLTYIIIYEALMLKNRFIELTQMTDRKERIGSKLTLPITIIAVDSQFSEIQKILDTFSNNNDSINQLRNQYKKTANPNKQKSLGQSVNRAAKQNKALLKQIQQKLKEINTKQQKDFQEGKKANTLKVAQLNQRANQLIQEYHQSQEKFTTGVKDTIRRQATIIQGDITETEVESIMRNPEQGQEMLRAKLLDSPSVQLENAVSDIVDKYRDILQLEKNMNECLEMMQQMALLVALTSQQLQSIEQNVLNAQNFTRQADEKLVQAKKHHKSAKKKMCCIIMLLIAAIGAILIPILLTQL